MSVTPDEFSRIGVPIVRSIASIADQVRPHGNGGRDVVGDVVGGIHAMIVARELDDDERRFKVLEAEIMALATWIYRERQAEFEDFIQNSARLVVLNAMLAMHEQDKN